MLQAFQFDNLPIAIILWLAVYSVDYYLTLYGNQLRAKYAMAHLGTDGSYELNPFYQRDVDKNNRFSRRFIFTLSLFTIWLVFMWFGAQWIKVPALFSAAAGYVLLLEVPVLSIHVQNISQFTFMQTPGAVVGSVTYARWITVSLAARQMGYWLVVYGGLFLLTGNWLFVGGVLAMLRPFIRYGDMGRKLREKSPTVTIPKDNVIQPTPIRGDDTNNSKETSKQQ